MTITQQPAMSSTAIRQRPGGRLVARPHVARRQVLMRLGFLVFGTACAIAVALVVVVAAVMMLAGSLVP